MSDNKYFDNYTRILENPKNFGKEVSEVRILDGFNKKLERESDLENSNMTHKRSINKAGKYIAIASVILILLSGIIPQTPIYGLYQSVFKFIPGVGIIETNDEKNIRYATTKSYKLENSDEYIEVKYAFIEGQQLELRMITNAKDIEYNIKDGIETGIYIVVNGHKQYLRNYSMAGSPGGSEPVVIEAGYELSLDENKQVELILGSYSFSDDLRIRLEEVSENFNVDLSGHSFMADDILVFADTIIEGNLIKINLSSIKPDYVRNVGFYLINPQADKKIEGLYLIDSKGNQFFPNDKLREENNDLFNNFYFEVNDDSENLELIVPNVIVYTNVIDKVELTVPDFGSKKKLNHDFEVNQMLITLNEVAFINGEELTISEEINTPVIKLDFNHEKINGKDTYVWKVWPNINLTKQFSAEGGFSSSVVAPNWDNESQSGSCYMIYDNMSAKDHLSLDMKFELLIKGPFKIEVERNKNRD